MSASNLSEVRLWTNAKEREKYENLAGKDRSLTALQSSVAYLSCNCLDSGSCMRHCFADLYAILKCTEKLERAYVRDGVTAKDYEAQCEKLIAQFRMLWGSMKQTVSRIAQVSNTNIHQLQQFHTTM